MNTTEQYPQFDIVFLINEAQMSYHDQFLWLGFIKYQISRLMGPK